MAEFATFVEVDFSGNGTWTDITPYVREADGIRITRGRGDEQSDVQPGTMSLTLDNRDRRFTPGLAASPYYPNVRKGVPIRCWVGAPGFLVTNSNFETDTSAWIAGGTVPPSLSRQSSWSPGVAEGGTASLRIDWKTGGSGPDVHTTISDLATGRTYTASAYVYVSAGSPAVRLEIAGGVNPYTTVTGSWQRITCTFTATSRTHTLLITPQTITTGTAYVDCVQVDLGGTATSYGTKTTVSFPRFHGYVNEWPVTWESGNALILSHITATDVFKRLGNLAPMRSLLEEEMLALGPDAYYTLGEASGSTSAGDTSGDGQAALSIFQVAGAGGEVKFGDGTGPGTDGLPAVVFTPASATAGKGIHTNLAAAPSDGNWVLACWISTTTPGREFVQLGYQPYPNGDLATAIGTTASGQLRVRAYFYGSATPDGGSTIGGPNLANGTTHFVAIQRTTASNAVYAYVDGAAVGTGFVISNTSPSNQYNLLSVGGFMHGLAADLFAGTVAHVWYANRATMPNWSNVWTSGNGSTETTTARFARLCRLLGVTGRVVGTTSKVIAPQAAGGKSPIQAIRDVAGVEVGVVYASRVDGAVVFECRNHRWDKPPGLTLTNEDLREGDLQWSDDDQYLVNDVMNTREGGAVQRATNPLSIAKYGKYSRSQTLPWATDYDAYLDAYYQQGNGYDPQPRISRFTVVANARPLHSPILGLDLSSVVRLTNLPAGSPSTTTDVFVEGYTETIEFNHHTITFHTSPATGLVHP
ncbi:carbohydrate binding domain-containing protein [Streptosporangium canum]|uniref:carbohydrate binding domain-containing protein n=1 Tax=Streptosporangium canum TaxID=324952 RepID=UPI0036BD571B